VPQDYAVAPIGRLPAAPLHQEPRSARAAASPVNLEIFDPDRIDRFVYDLKSNIELCNLKKIYEDIAELIPEMTGPSFDEMMKNVFA